MPLKTQSELLNHYQPPGEQTRRAFLAWMGRLGLNVALAPLVFKTLEGLGVLPTGALAAPFPRNPVTARYWRQLPGGQVQCLLCPRQEVLAPGQMGFCRARQNLKGTLVTHAYGQPCVLNLDPVEMNPLNHFHPGMKVLALAHAGCNLRCAYCQNWQFS